MKRSKTCYNAISISIILSNWFNIFITATCITLMWCGFSDEYFLNTWDDCLVRSIVLHLKSNFIKLHLNVSDEQFQFWFRFSTPNDHLVNDTSQWYNVLVWLFFSSYLYCNSITVLKGFKVHIYTCKCFTVEQFPVKVQYNRASNTFTTQTCQTITIIENIWGNIMPRMNTKRCRNMKHAHILIYEQDILNLLKHHYNRATISTKSSEDLMQY